MDNVRASIRAVEAIINLAIEQRTINLPQVIFYQKNKLNISDMHYSHLWSLVLFKRSSYLFVNKLELLILQSH